LTEDLGVVPGDLPVRGGVELEVVVGVTADTNALEVELLDLPALAALDVLQEDHAFSGTGTWRPERRCSVEPRGRTTPWSQQDPDLKRPLAPVS